MASTSLIEGSLRLLKSAPDNQFSPSAKALVKDWDNKTDPAKVQETIDQVKRHNMGSKTAINLLTNIIFNLKED